MSDKQMKDAKKKIKFISKESEKETETSKYYNSLDREEIENSVLMLAEATEDEIFELVSVNPIHYISIFEHYKGDSIIENNPFIVSRTLGNLFIKFKYGKASKFHSIGFIDNNIPDSEVLECLQREIEICCKMEKDLEVEARKNFLVNMLTDPTNPSQKDTVFSKDDFQKKYDAQKKINDEYNFDFPKTSKKDLVKAGYTDFPPGFKMPEELKPVPPNSPPTASGPTVVVGLDFNGVIPISDDKPETDPEKPVIKTKEKEKEKEKEKGKMNLDFLFPSGDKPRVLPGSNMYQLESPSVITESSYEYDSTGRKILTVRTTTITKIYVDNKN